MKIAFRLARRLTIFLAAGLLPAISGQSPDPGAIEETFVSGGGRVTVSLSPSLGQKPAEVLAWVGLAAKAVTAYYGRYPVSAVHIFVAPRAGDPVNSGSEHVGRIIIIRLDPEATPEDLKRDWTLTHEMFHLGFPSLDRSYHYLEEGLSDYLEPLARARVGQLSARKVWKDFIEGMPNGLPQAGDAGLDGTRDWGRTYWGGCIFWLLVDLDVRQRTKNARSLDDAIRAMVNAGGTGGSDWSLERVMDVGDAATGTDSIHKIHLLLGAKPFDPHLEELWRKLGVREERGRIAFDETAPLAAMRRSMTQSKNPALPLASTVRFWRWSPWATAATTLPMPETWSVRWAASR